MNLTKWLADQNYKHVEYVSLGGKLPDLVGYNEHEIVAFEEKKYAEELPNAIGQVHHSSRSRYRKGGRLRESGDREAS